VRSRNSVVDYVVTIRRKDEGVSMCDGKDMGRIEKMRVEMCLFTHFVHGVSHPAPYAMKVTDSRPVMEGSGALRPLNSYAAVSPNPFPTLSTASATDV
jgi:hypothetical protein